MAKLVFLDEHRSDRVFRFTNESTSVGRGAHNDLVVDDPSVSENHCEILVHLTEVIIREWSSTNGTYVDGKRVRQQLPVKDGQTIHFGTVAARLELEPQDTPWAPDPSVESAIHELPPRPPAQTNIHLKHDPLKKTQPQPRIPSDPTEVLERPPVPTPEPVSAPSATLRPLSTRQRLPRGIMWWVILVGVVATGLTLLFWAFR